MKTTLMVLATIGLVLIVLWIGNTLEHALYAALPTGLAGFILIATTLAAPFCIGAIRNRTTPWEEFWDFLK